MPEIDLGDRSGLIDLIYGPPKEGTVSAANSVNTLNTTAKDNVQNEKQEQKQQRKWKVSCSFCTALFLFVLAGAAIFLSGFCSYWFTKQDFERKLALANYMPIQRKNVSGLQGVPEPEYEDEPDIPAPSFEELRLPDSFAPLWYNCTVKVPLTAGHHIEGHILLKLRVTEETDKLVINAKDIAFPEVGKIKLLKEKTNVVKREAGNATEPAEEEENSNENENTETLIQQVTTQETVTTAPKVAAPKYEPSGVSVVGVQYNDTVEKTTLTLDKMLKNGDEVILQMPFKAKLGNTPYGPFLSTYKNRDGSSERAFTTRSLPTGARRLFPCFDEPRFQAPLKLSVIHPEGTVALANTPEISTEKTEAGWVETTFEESATVPVHHLALSVFNFENKNTTTDSNKIVNIWSRPDAINNTEFALETVPQIVSVLENFYGFPIPGQKLDIVAVPGVITREGNPGLLLLTESSVLYDPNVDDVINKVHIVQKLTHQLNKQYIGGLVSPSEWDSLWIQEALAHYVETLALQKFFGNTEPQLEHDLVNSVEKTLNLDAFSSSHPLSIDRETSREATEMNDVVTKEKGAAVLRMVRAVLGDSAFQKGIRNYLSSSTDGHSNYTQLWKSLQSEVPKQMKSWDGKHFDVAEFANKWVLQMGYPVVDVYRLDGQTVEISQHRFKLDNKTPEQSKFRNALYWYKWDVPLFNVVNGDMKPMTWLHEATRVPLNVTDEILINGNSDGFYRVNYDEAAWKAIQNRLESDHGSFTAPARGRILSDVFALAAANHIPYETALNMTEYLPKEEEFAPTVIALNGLVNLYKILEDTEEADKAKKFALERIQDQFGSIKDIGSLTSQMENDYLPLKRKLAIVESYCKLNRNKCKKAFTTIVEEKLFTPCKDFSIASDCSMVPPPLRSTVYCDAVKYGDEETFETIYKFAQNEISATERDRLTAALGCSRDPVALRRLLRQNLLSENRTLSREDIPTFVETAATSDVGSLIVSDFLLDNWKLLREKLAEDPYVLSAALTDGLRPEDKRQIKLLEQFAEEHPGAKAFGSFRSQLEKGRSRVDWLRRNTKQLANSFKEL